VRANIYISQVVDANWHAYNFEIVSTGIASTRRGGTAYFSSERVALFCVGELIRDELIKQGALEQASVVRVEHAAPWGGTP
jgi:hypothetical protein